MVAAGMSTPPKGRPVRPRVLVLYNHPEQDATCTFGAPASLAGMGRALGERGLDVVFANADDDVDRISDAVVVHRPHLIFNLVQQFYGDDTKCAAVVGMLDLFGYPCTGSDSLSIALCQDRARCHALLAAAGVPVPAFATVYRAQDTHPELRFPVVVSQTNDDIYDDPVHSPLIQDADTLARRVGEVLAEYSPPALIEEHHGGRRIHAVVVGNRAPQVLPLIERTAAGNPAEVRYDCARLPEATEQQIGSLARVAFRTLECRDIAQVDFALTDVGPFVLHVRPVVDWVESGPLDVAAKASELKPEGLMTAIVKACLDRLPSTPDDERASAASAAPTDGPTEAPPAPAAETTSSS